MSKAGTIVEQELFSNLSGCEADCYGLSGLAKRRCLRDCQDSGNSTGAAKGVNTENLGGILSGIAELVNAGGSIYATHVSQQSGQLIPNFNYPAGTFNTPPVAGFPQGDEELRRRRNRNTILIGVGVVAILGVAAYFTLKKD